MRPVELKLRNFRSYFGEVGAFEFTDRRLLGIVGPIGSGKSSLLDAIAFALYGRTPTVAANTKSLIHQRADECTVSLRFRVEEETWEAVRMLRRKGASQHALYRIVPGEDEPAERITLEGDVNAKIIELLGLEFEAFGRSVLLAQNRFAEFLRARPAERDKVLKGVFGHDRIDAMREAARHRAGEASVEVEKLDVRVAHIDRLTAAIADQRDQLAALDARVAALDLAAGEVADLLDSIAAAEQAESKAQGDLADLAEVRRRFPKTEAAGRVIALANEAEGIRRDRAEDLEAARSKLAGAEAQIEKRRAADDPAVIEGATALLVRVEAARTAATRARTSAERAEALHAKRSAEAENATAGVESLAAEVAAAEASDKAASGALASATERLHRAQHAEMSAELRAGLHTGEPCPVCAQSVATLPPAIDAPQLDDARVAHDEAAAVAESAASALAGMAQAYAAARAEGEASQRAVAAAAEAAATAAEEASVARDEVGAIESELQQLLGEGRPESLLADRREGWSAAEKAVADGREGVDRARVAHDQAIRDEQEAAKAVAALRVDLTDLAARIGASAVDSDGSPEAVAAAMAELISFADDAVEGATKAAKEAAETRTAAAGRLSVVLTDLEVSGEFAAAVGDARGRSDVLRAEIEKAEQEIEGGAEAVAARDGAAARRTRFERVASDLTDSKFVRYLLDDERARLADLGSTHFLRLTSGRYRFSGDGKFDVVDLTAAEAVRKAESLSGGETFLASLALALALAEMVARTGGRLDAFFLDEGFGSLDPEHLDLAMDGIEALVADGQERLVVVVSHVPEMRDRIEDLIVLDRDAVTGDTRVLRS